MNCILRKKSELTSPMAGSPDYNAGPGDFALIDNEDGTMTLAVSDGAGNPSPIDPGEAKMTVESANPDVVEITEHSGFTWREAVAERYATSPSSPVPNIPPPEPTLASTPPPPASPEGPAQPGSGAVASIMATITWEGEDRPYMLEWKDTVVNHPEHGPSLERSQVSVRQSYGV